MTQKKETINAYLKQYENEQQIIREGCIDFGEWLLKECGEFTTISMEQLYELYLKEQLKQKQYL